MVVPVRVGVRVVFDVVFGLIIGIGIGYALRAYISHRRHSRRRHRTA
jgi:hypothetical protein